MPDLCGTNVLHIIGIGSPFGDDVVGWRIVEWLSHSPHFAPFAAHLNFEQSDRPGASLLASMEGKEDVMLIDAMISSGIPGTVKVFKNDEIDTADGLLSSHGFGVVEALALGRVLGVLPPSLQLIGVEIPPLEEGPSPRQPWLEEAVAKIESALMVQISAKNCEQRLKTTS